MNVQYITQLSLLTVCIVISTITIIITTTSAWYVLTVD